MKKKTKKKIIHFFLIIIILLGAIFLDESGYVNLDPTDDINYKQTDALPATFLENESLKVYFIDVGQADSILITTNGENMLIDAGNNEDGEKLTTYLHSLGINSFKYVVGTHAHEDHIGGMDNIINNFSIENFFMPDAITTTKTFEDVLDALENKQLAFTTPEEDATFSLANAKFTVLHIDGNQKDLNDTSIVLKMVYGNTSFLFMGDATSEIEEKIITKNIQSDVLKVAHHGSEYSSTTAFLKKVAPKYAIIEVGVNNTYKHPKDITLKKLQNIGAKIYRTDEDGTIIATTDGTNITFETVKTDTNG